ncbi:(Fe-S)-binding protein [Hydrotalea sp.]|uniref:(Fe-S)-binding protein n=1 Tax=Hydrotalea sp. TaxID=2881279 RepID=UPI002624A195|nr:(Fe-S)-binding protein [Hydrotalea sp.]
MNVQLFIPCFIDQLFPQVGFNMIKVLQKAGCTVHYNTNQTCCGQPAFNAGFWGESKEVCAKFVHDFSGNDYVVAPSASCIGFVKNYYPKLFENTSLHNEVKALTGKVFEFSGFLVNVLNIENIGASFPAKVSYHDSCAALRECGLKQEPRKLLQQVAGLELVEMNDVETCCGFGGTFAVKFEPISAAMGDQKITNALATDAAYIVSTDMSCLMHLQGIINHQQKPIQVIHLADVLASGW